MNIKARPVEDFDRVLMKIYDMWARGIYSRSTAQKRARLVHTLIYWNTRRHGLTTDPNILIDLGLVEQPRIPKIRLHLIADFLFFKTPLVEAVKRWDMLGFDLEINTDYYKDMDHQLLMLPPRQAAITDQEKTSNKQDNINTFLAFCCGKSTDEYNRRLAILAQ